MSILGTIHFKKQALHTWDCTPECETNPALTYLILLCLFHAPLFCLPTYQATLPAYELCVPLVSRCNLRQFVTGHR